MAQLSNKTGKVLRQLIDAEGITITELARRTGLVQPVVYRMASGETINPKIDTLIPLAKYFKITIDQLVGQQSDLTNNHPVKIISDGTRLPLLSWQEATDWPDVTLSEKSTKYLYTNATVSSSSFALTIKDSTMAPHFPERSIIIVDSQLPLKNKQFAIIQIKKRKEALFRQVLLDGHDITLKPLNSDFKVTHLTKSDQYKVLGMVVEVITHTKDITS